jgi:hypothetical protein
LEDFYLLYYIDGRTVAWSLCTEYCTEYCTYTYVLVSMNAADQARANAERIVNASAAAANPDVPPVMNIPPVALAAVLPPAQVVIDPAALAQLLAACQPQPHAAGAIAPERAGFTRLKAFSSTDAVEWMSWKTHYLEVCEINAWPNIRQVREARAAMSEKAARHMADVVPVYVPDPAAVPPVLVTTWQDLIARYQEKFMPAAAGVYSRAEYNIAKQISSEDVGGWHARLCDLYNRAYPGQEVDNNLPLIEKFVTQLINKEVGKFVFERDPKTFAGALVLAQIKTATDVTFKSASRGASIHSFTKPSKNGVNYTGKGRGGRRSGRRKSGGSPERREGEASKCWICNSASHQRAKCPVWIKAMAFAKKETGGGYAPDRQTGGISGGASRGRANYRGRASSGRRPSLSALASTTAPARRDGRSPVPEGKDQWEESEN